VRNASTLAGSLRTLADFAEIRGAITEGADLRQAARAVDALKPAAAADLLARARRNTLQDQPGIPGGVWPVIQAVAVQGDVAVLQTAQASLPALHTHLLTAAVIRPDEAAALVSRCDVVTLADLRAALAEQRVAQLGEALSSRLERAARALELGGWFMPLGRARDALDAFAADIGVAQVPVDLVAVAGDVRRFEALVETLAIVVRTSDPAMAVDAICALPPVEAVPYRSARRALVAVQQGEIDIRVASPDQYGTALFEATGSPSHVAAIRRRGESRSSVGNEEEIYSAAGLSYVPPELRQNTGEIEAAASGRLPSLLTRQHVRGDLHMHTTYSDGGDTLETMVAACCRLGYEYMAITDHSQRAAASRTLSRRDLSRQRDEIASLRLRYPGIAILHGVEVDIMPDGSLDFSDRILESLDIVLASLHDPAHHDGARLTRRCIQAIRHPLVTIVTHPANRLVGRRDGYPMDFEAVYAAAAEAGTALEVDGAPSHLDLDGAHARAAIAAGVTLSVDSDCHRARLLARQMELGIGTARRGWVEPRHVLNTRPLEEVRAFIAAKRSRR
jgi:DNA polymerase (family 10)